MVCDVSSFPNFPNIAAHVEAIRGLVNIDVFVALLNVVEVASGPAPIYVDEWEALNQALARLAELEAALDRSVT